MPWQEIIVETTEYETGTAVRVLAMLASREDIVVGFEVVQLVHSLQTATRAEEGAGASDEVVVASLCHDIGKVVSVINHSLVAAEMLRPYVSQDTYHVIEAHQDFKVSQHYYEYLGAIQTRRQKYEGAPWYFWPRSSPTSGTRTASIPTTPPSRPRTSSPLSARSPPCRGPFESWRNRPHATRSASARPPTWWAPTPPGQ
jgi:predicted HD phosphohydrolase